MRYSSMSTAHNVVEREVGYQGTRPSAELGNPVEGGLDSGGWLQRTSVAAESRSHEAVPARCHKYIRATEEDAGMAGDSNQAVGGQAGGQSTSRDSEIYLPRPKRVLPAADVL